LPPCQIINHKSPTNISTLSCLHLAHISRQTGCQYSPIAQGSVEVRVPCQQQLVAASFHHTSNIFTLFWQLTLDITAHKRQMADDHCLNKSIALLVSGGRSARSDIAQLQCSLGPLPHSIRSRDLPCARDCADQRTELDMYRFKVLTLYISLKLC
jgi:hypothetical protein